MRACRALLAACSLWPLGSASALAQEVFAGTWVVSDAQAAPWVGDAVETPINDAVRHGRFTFHEDRVEGPPPFNCGQVQYRVHEVGPEYLFEGGLTDPAKQAPALGFTSDKIVSLSVGCVSNGADIGMDVDLIDRDTAVFALDNVIYRMVRAPGP